MKTRLRIVGDIERKPMDEVQVELIIAEKRIRRKFGTLANFIKHCQEEQKRKDAEKLADQLRRINEA